MVKGAYFRFLEKASTPSSGSDFIVFLHCAAVTLLQRGKVPMQGGKTPVMGRPY